MSAISEAEFGGNSYQDDLLAGYESLRADRDWSPEVMAANIERQDASLAAEYRSRFCTDNKAPRSRKAAPKSEA